jgi:hypothetical protein
MVNTEYVLILTGGWMVYSYVQLYFVKVLCEKFLVYLTKMNTIYLDKIFKICKLQKNSYIYSYKANT